MEFELETMIRSLVAQHKFRIDEKHILRERAQRGFTTEEVLYSLKNGFLYKLQKPHRVLWGYQQDKNLIVLSLWLLDVDGEFAVNWHKSNSLIIDLVYVKTAYRKDA